MTEVLDFQSFNELEKTNKGVEMSETVKNSNKEDVWQVVFTWKDKEAKKNQIIGPISVSAKNERTAILRASLEKYKELITADLLTIDAKATIF